MHLPYVDPLATYSKFQPTRDACHDLDTGRCWSYAALDSAVDRTASWLIEQTGPATGDRVATLARNCVELLILQLACARAGAIFVPLNWRLAPAEISFLVEDAAPAILFHDSDFVEAARTAAAGARTRFYDLQEAGEGLHMLVDEGTAKPPAEARRALDAPATLLYTSGTSGRPKGVIVTEANAYFGCSNFIHGNGVSRTSVFLCDMPMFHTAGLYAAVRTPLLAGGTVLISKGFDAARTLARLGDPALRISHYFSVPQMAQRLWQEPSFDPVALRRLTIYAVGGAPSPPAQIERFIRAGIPMSNGFGMSETGSNFGVPLDDPEAVIAKRGTCGLPYLWVQARVVDEKGKDAPHGAAGELWIAGPSVTPGYWNRPEETRKAFEGPWFKTGDAAIRDVDGFYYLVDRKKDMFISGGENVYPAEVEAVLAELEDVAEAAVIGVPHLKWGEVGRAYVIPKGGAHLAEHDLRSHCRERLARYKVPETFVITHTIPRTASGKVQKHLLKSRAAAEGGGAAKT